MPERSVFSTAARVMAGGGVIIYPTEGVFGLGCLPTDETAATRIMTIKQRGRDAGLVLVAAELEQLMPFVAAEDAVLLSERIMETQRPVTWVVGASQSAPDWITGGRETIAMRVSRHDVVRGLCQAVNSALISTSANRTGQAPITDPAELHREFAAEVDLIVPGEIGGHGGATEIRQASDGLVLRPGPVRADTT